MGDKKMSDDEFIGTLMATTALPYPSVSDLRAEARRARTAEATLTAERDAARSEAKGLREALERYGQHETLCFDELLRPDCNCGLSAALAATGEREGA